jgi:hypothetical protein
MEHRYFALARFSRISREVISDPSFGVGHRPASRRVGRSPSDYLFGIDQKG